MDNCVEIKECIACGGTHLVPLLDLGKQPLANSFLKSESQVEPVFPLATNYCKNCYHVQLTHKVNPDLLFKNYFSVRSWQRGPNLTSYKLWSVTGPSPGISKSKSISKRYDLSPFLV